MKNNWKEIKNYYVHNNVTLEDCAKKFKVSLRTAQTHCSKEKWSDMREEKRAEVAQKSEEKIVDRKVAVNEKHFELYEKALKVLELLFNNTNKKMSPDVLYQLVKIIREIQQGQRLCLNMGTDEGPATVPEIRIISGLDVEKI